MAERREGASAVAGADACTKDPACDRHYLQAQVASKAGQLSDALIEYQAAYAIQPVPRLLFNIARLAHKLNQLKEAASSYQAYLNLKSGTEPEVLAKAKEYLAEIERTQGPTTTSASTTPPANAQVPAAPAGTAVSSPVTDSPAPPRSLQRSNLMIGLGTSLSLLGGVVAGIGTAALVVDGSCAQMISTGAGSQCDQIYRSQTLGLVLVPVGVVVLGGGIGLFAYGAKLRLRK